MSDHVETPSRLDRILETQGKEACQSEFNSVLRRGQSNAVALLTETPLSYPCFFILIPQINKRKLLQYVSPVMKTAAAITTQILHPEFTANRNYLKVRQNTAYEALKWMLSTGWMYDDDAEIRMVLDTVASTLLNTYRDKEAMQTVCDMMIRRGVKGYNTHYLVWAYFHTHDCASIRLMAEYLHAEDAPARTCAAQFLCANRIEENTDTYENFMRWLHENDPFLYFTNESPQYAGNPQIYKVDLERKYLNKKSDRYERLPAVPESDREEAALAAFRKCENTSKRLLCNYSQTLCKQNRAHWEDWIASPLEVQTQQARAFQEGKL